MLGLGLRRVSGGVRSCASPTLHCSSAHPYVSTSVLVAAAACLSSAEYLRRMLQKCSEGRQSDVQLVVRGAEACVGAAGVIAAAIGDRKVAFGHRAVEQPVVRQLLTQHH
jgi:hypothetical protein